MCDVLVIGAGPGGGNAALQCARQGLSTMLIEDHSAIGTPVHCGECISDLVCDNLNLDLPEHVISKRVHGIRVIFPDGTEKCLTEEGYVLEKHLFERWIADKAVEALQEFVSHRKGDAFGVTLFGTEVLHWVPLTKDLDALKHSAPFMKPEAMPPYMGGTRIGLALRSVHKILADRPKGDKMIVLISDGSSGDLRGQGDKISSDLNGDDIVLGGTTNDMITTGTEQSGDDSRDIVLGDNGFVAFDSEARVATISSTNTDIGGNDTITTGGGPAGKIRLLGAPPAAAPCFCPHSCGAGSAHSGVAWAGCSSHSCWACSSNSCWAWAGCASNSCWA